MCQKKHAEGGGVKVQVKDNNNGDGKKTHQI